VKASRIVFVAGASAAMLAAGWRVGSLPLPTVALAEPATGRVSAGASPSATASVGASGSSPAPTATATTTAPPAAPAGPTGVFVGPAVGTSYGTMQVQLAINDGVITQVQPLVVGLSDGTSRRINAGAVPQLQARVLESQTWSVAYVSGASYTSQGILASVQGAMAQAGL
jgi:uncharacterized protein with FMN-binding domain